MKYIKTYAIFESEHKADIEEALKTGYCEFYYYKNDGSKRHAYGTLKEAFLKTVWEPSDKEKEKSTGYIAYWDIERKEFRMFHKDMFISLEDKEDTLKEFLEKYPKLEKKVKKAKEKLKEEQSEEKHDDKKHKDEEPEKDKSEDTESEDKEKTED